MKIFRLLKLFGFKCVVAILLLSSLGVNALPQFEDEVHEGVASCASSVCHGKATPSDKSHVMLNEYKTWLTEDRHASAYKTLLSSESKRIASNLGLSAPAHKSDICLDCHADNVAVEKRGKEFRIEDGVGCEACHGGAEKWLESHTEAGVSHQDNLANNMYATEDGYARATLCLSCHLGTDDKFVNHKIMGAGHPRLVFELESFTANQPAHYKVDEDYRQRKGEFSGLNMWAVGQLQSAVSTLELIQRHVLNDSGNLFPELVLFDCHSCHHEMSDLRWAKTQNTGVVAPGAVRLNLVNFLMLKEFVAVLMPNESQGYDRLLQKLGPASQASAPQLKLLVPELENQLEKIKKTITQTKYGAAEVKKLRLRLLAQASRGEYRDYIVAEQAFYSIEGFTIGLDEFNRYQTQLDKLFNALKSESSFKPDKFKSLARSVQGNFNE